MGASQSSPKVFKNDTPLQLSQEVIDDLSARLADPRTTPERQNALDDQVRAKIQAELAHLRKSEQEMRLQLEAALEKENLDREKAVSGKASQDAGSVQNSTALLGDLDELKSKVDRFKSRKGLDDYPQVKQNAEAVAKCFKENPTTTLNCTLEVDEFKASVAKAEQEYFKSLR